MDYKDYIKNLNNEFKNINQKNIFKDPREKYVSDYRVPSGCAVFGIINENGDLFDGSMVIDGIEMMHDRSNGLGGGFAAYGIYPEYKDNYAFHIFYNDSLARKESESLMQRAFKILYSDEIPTKKVGSVVSPPIIARYFLSPKNIFMEIEGYDKENGLADEIINRAEDEFVANFVSSFNADSCNAYIISSGKNMGIFKGVGYPEDIGEFYKLNEYKAYIWTSHGRFPTNSTGWWGGAHPFGFLNWSVVHNGEISSYGTNKRFVSGFGYKCSFSTDTEVLAYLFDLLVRKHGINLYLINYILAAPLWKDIEILPEDIKKFLTALRIIYAKALVNGPFSIIVGNNNFMYALNDRIKLRPLVAAKKGKFTFVSSEESAIRKVCHDPDTIWNPKGGEPVIVYIKGKEPKLQPSFKISRENFLESMSGFDNSFAGILK
ncbi:MAG: class II glutamine amidotransferase [Candidatus Humimicrobiaceae bacterium]